MRDKSERPNPTPIPFVPMNAPTIRANNVLVAYGSANGSISVLMIDQRFAPVTSVGEPPVNANFEVGRFELSPRALRALLDTANQAASAYEVANGHPLPTIAQFDARGAMPGLDALIQQSPKPGESA